MAAARKRGTGTQEDTAFTIRLASPADAENIARLSTQLGYPSTPEQAARRLSAIKHDKDHAVYVAESADRNVVGWVHVHRTRLMESDPEAELGGLIVDENCRRSGVGHMLTERAEQWTREKGLKSIYVRSNILRKDAHAFYLSLGYRLIKTQQAFRKFLG